MTIESNDATPQRTLPEGGALRQGARGAGALQAAGHREDVPAAAGAAAGGHRRQPAEGRRGGPGGPAVEPGRRRAARRRRAGRDHAAGGDRPRRHHRRRGAPCLLGADAPVRRRVRHLGRGRRRVTDQVGDRLGGAELARRRRGGVRRAGLGRPPAGVPGGGAPDRDREAARGHDRRVLVPRPLRARPGPSSRCPRRATIAATGHPPDRPPPTTRARSTWPRSATTCARWWPGWSLWAAITSSSTRPTTARCATRTPAPPWSRRAATRKRSWRSTRPSTARCLTG